MNPSSASARLSKTDLLKLVHELEVHQIELELQNEELIRSKEVDDRILLTGLDVSDQRQQANVNTARLALIKFADSHSLDELLEETLNETENLTGSTIGFYHFVEKDRRTLLLQNWSTRTKRDFCMAEGKGRHYDVDLAGVWADCLRTGKPAIHNDYSTVGGKKGLPAGHAHIIRELVVPVIRNGIIMAILGVGNKPFDYTETDLKMVSQLADLAWDFTARKKTEDTLKASEIRLQDIIANSAAGYFLIDLQGLFSQVNDAWLQMHGYNSVDEVIGRHFSITQTEDMQESAKRVVKTLLAGGAIPTGEFVRRCKDGSVRYHTFSARHVMKEGKIIGIEGFLIDSTERRRSELEIRQNNEELVRLNAEKDKFFSIIAHDLRGPFNNFLGFTQMMAEDLPSLTPDEIKKISQAMRKSAINLYNLLENLLEWSRINRGLTNFNPAPFSLAPAIAERIQTVQGFAEKKGIAISLDIPSELKVLADGYMLGSIIHNLAFNAVKFTPAGGSVSISAAASDGFVKISVTDTGIGMNPDLLSKLFRLDENPHRRGTEGEPSTGLGLMICKEFIEKHDGRIWAESEEGKGSKFYFTLPEP